MAKTVYVAMLADIVFDRPLNAARRRCRYGYQAMMARHLKWGLRPRPAHEGQRMVCVRRQCPVKIQGGGEVVSSGLAVL